MKGKELYELGCRFPETVIPGGLQAVIPLVSYKEAQGWIGEYWYYVPGKHVPRMYVKLHLPEGLPMEIIPLGSHLKTDQIPAPPRILSRKEQDYLNRCAGMVESAGSEGTECVGLFGDWYMQLTPKQQLAYSICRQSLKTENTGATTETPPPDWLLETWTAEHLKKVLDDTPVRDQEPALQPTQAGMELWQLGEKLAENAGVPRELVQGLPRLSFDDTYGWIIEFWYYYRNAGLAWWLFDEPKYYLQAVLSDRRLLKLKNLTGETVFRQSWLDAWGIGWTCRKELEYLACCEQLMAQGDPDEEQITALQGLWLQAHPKEYVRWLAWHSGLREAARRWTLSANRIPGNDFLRVLWANEMEKGVRLGTQEMAEKCIDMLERYRKEQKP